VRGFEQKKGILKKLLHTIQQKIVFATHNKWKKFHLDMKFAFHHGNLEEEVS
jgi:hypothetical protein